MYLTFDYTKDKNKVTNKFINIQPIHLVEKQFS